MTDFEAAFIEEHWDDQFRDEPVDVEAEMAAFAEEYNQMKELSDDVVSNFRERLNEEEVVRDEKGQFAPRSEIEQDPDRSVAGEDDGPGSIDEASREEILATAEQELDQSTFEFLRDETETADEARDMLRDGDGDVLDLDDFTEQLDGSEYHETVITPTEHVGEYDLNGVHPEMQERLSSEVEQIATEHGLPDDHIDAVHSDTTRGSLGAGNGYWSWRNDELFINPDVMEEVQSGDYTPRDEVVGESFEDLVRHEMVHSLHDAASDVQRSATLDADEAELLSSEISQYAASNPQEAVAEIGVMKLRGESIPPEAESIYQKYGGPEI